MRRFGLFICVLITLFSLSTSASGQILDGIHRQSTLEQPWVIELYTSQGCSSCPPAEAWLSEFSTESALWNTYFPLAFHVTYWDYLGWKDPYGQKAFSQRQYDHLNQRHTRAAYTPQFVVNGAEWRGWFNRDFTPVFTSAAKPVGVLTAAVLHGELSASYVPSKEQMSANRQLDSAETIQAYHLHFAIVGAGLSTQVTRGENRNKQLRHDFAVLQHQVFLPQDKVSALDDKAMFRAVASSATHRFAENSPFSATALTFSGQLENVDIAQAPTLAWVVWLEYQGKALQAVGDWLPTL